MHCQRRRQGSRQDAGSGSRCQSPYGDLVSSVNPEHVAMAIVPRGAFDQLRGNVRHVFGLTGPQDPGHAGG